MGARANIEAVLGRNPWLWLVPTPVDDDALESTRCGVSFHPTEHQELLAVLGRLGLSGQQLYVDMLPPARRQAVLAAAAAAAGMEEGRGARAHRDGGGEGGEEEEDEEAGLVVSGRR